MDKFYRSHNFILPRLPFSNILVGKHKISIKLTIHYGRLMKKINLSINLYHYQLNFKNIYVHYLGNKILLTYVYMVRKYHLFFHCSQNSDLNKAQSKRDGN